MDVRIKRAYEPAEQTDGYRVLVDRLWPRGVSKRDARLDEWARELAPSPELRPWFGHDPARFGEFRRRYRQELTRREEELHALRGRAREGTLTLVYAARDREHNGAVVVAELLREPAELTVQTLEDWVRAGAHWRVLHHGERLAIVELQQCTGERVEVLESSDQELIAYLEGLESDLDLVTSDGQGG
jgi:uncharacterized protein YeaO (DUF488 family)